MIETRKKLIVGCCVVALCAACGGSRSGANKSASSQLAANSQTVNANANANTNANGAGQPDMAKLDADIMQLEAQLTDKPDDNSLRSSVAEAYVRRGAANYAAHNLKDALRDYQAALNYDPANEEAELRVTQLNQEIGGGLRTDDGKPATINAKPGASNSNK